MQHVEQSRCYKSCCVLVEVSIEMIKIMYYKQTAVNMWFQSLQSRQKCVSVCISRSDLLTHAVYAIRSQQIDRLLDKVSATTVEHPKAQVLQKLGLCGGCVQLSCGTEAIVCSKKTSKTVMKSDKVHLGRNTSKQSSNSCRFLLSEKRKKNL